MHWNEKLATKPTSEPVDLATAKAHLRVTDSAEDVYISRLIRVVRNQIEKMTNRALMTQQWDLWLRFSHRDRDRDCEEWWGAWAWHNMRRIQIPRGPVTSVDLVEVIADDGTTTTVDQSKYRVDTYMEPACIIFNTSIPDEGTIHIRYTAGETSADDVPVTCVQAILLLLASYYDNRVDETLAASTLTNVKLMNGVSSLIANDILIPCGVDN